MTVQKSLLTTLFSFFFLLLLTAQKNFKTNTQKLPFFVHEEVHDFIVKQYNVVLYDAEINSLSNADDLILLNPANQIGPTQNKDYKPPIFAAARMYRRKI